MVAGRAATDRNADAIAYTEAPHTPTQTPSHTHTQTLAMTQMISHNNSMK